MCYPPFNQFAFAPFDEPLLVSRTPPSQGWQMTATAAITVLWGIYVWATVALGFKASNLTNRGIVATGPYAYVRHPAYISKVSLWALSAYFLGEFNFFLVVTFIVVYFLRAWTEERHISLDTDYRSYKKKVPYRFIPRLF